MEQYIPFSGLATSPTALDAPDGQFSHIINLIPEDGILKSLVVGTDEDFRIGSPSSKLLYTHIGNDYCNHIIFDTYPTTGFWYIKDDENQHPRHQISGIPTSFLANAVESVGNILVLMGDDATYYLFWNGDGYEVIHDFTYDVHVSLHDGGVELTNSDEIELEHGAITINYTDADQFEGTISRAESMEVYNRLVAQLNKKIDEDDDAKHVFRGVSFGVAALRMYDTEYIAISDPFILAGAERDKLELTKLVRVNIGDNLSHKVTSIMHTGKYDIKVEMNSYMKKIISGVDIFVSLPIETWDVDKPYTVSASPREHYYDPFSLPYEKLSDGEIYERFDNLTFFKSLSMDFDENGSTEVKQIEKVSGAEKSISLADFRRARRSARISYNYNNRLHIAGTKTDYSAVMDNKIYYTVDSEEETIHHQATGDNEQDWYETVVYTKFLGGDIFGNNEFHAEDNFRTLDCKAIVNFSDGTAIYYEGSVVWPLPPIVSFPDRNASSIDLYVYDPEANQQEQYIKLHISLHSSVNFGLAYRLKTSVRSQENIKEFFFNISSEDTYEYIEENDYEEIDNDYYVSNFRLPALTNNLLRYSEAENPFVFPVTNYVGIGTAAIIGLATSTQPISEGQFGTAPLYVFTEDAVWVLTVLDDGTYAPRQPASRDVCINARTITPIDNAVVFATERGIMLISGNKTECLSEALSGTGEPYALEPSYLQAYAFLALEKEPQNVGGVERMVDAFIYEDVEVPDFRIDFMSRAGIFYDYQNQRLVVFNSSDSGKLAYVYSFRSGLWGAAKTDIKSVTHNYPVPMATFISEYDGDMHAGHAMTHSVYTEPCFFACTRPIKLDAPLSFKTIRAAIVHGRLASSRIKTALFASNDLDNWTLINTSTNHKLRGKLGNPWRYFRLAFTGMLAEISGSIDGVHIEYDVRWQNQIR